MQIKKFFRTKIIFPISRLLLGGVSPKKLALALAIGFALGCFPVLGPTTAICLLAGWIFRLNLPAVQLGNYISTPLQMALLLPAYKYGGILFGASGSPPDFSAMAVTVKNDPLTGFMEILPSIGQAIAVWALYSPFLFFMVYYLVRFLTSKPVLPGGEEDKIFTLPDTAR